MREIINYAVLINIPSFFILLLFYAYLFDFKYKMPTIDIFKYCILVSFIDGIVKYSVTSDFRTPIDVFFYIVLMMIMFRIKLLNIFISFLTLMFIYFIIQVVGLVPFILSGISFEMIDKSFKYMFIYACITNALILIITLIIVKKDWKITWFSVYQLFSDAKFEKYIDENMAFITPLLITFFVTSCATFVIASKNTHYFLFAMSIIIILSLIYLWLLNKINEYKRFKLIAEQQDAILKEHNL